MGEIKINFCLKKSFSQRDVTADLLWNTISGSGEKHTDLCRNTITCIYYNTSAYTRKKIKDNKIITIVTRSSKECLHFVVIICLWKIIHVLKKYQQTVVF